MPRKRTEITVPVAIMKSFTEPTKQYALTMHGVVLCSCPSAAYPQAGRRYGECKHTDEFERRYTARTLARDQIITEFKRLRVLLRAFDGGDHGTPMDMPTDPDLFDFRNHPRV